MAIKKKLSANPKTIAKAFGNDKADDALKAQAEKTKQEAEEGEASQRGEQ